MVDGEKTARSPWSRSGGGRGRAGRERQRKGAAVTGSFALVATMSLVGVSTAADVATAPQAEATFATGGDGRYVDSIDWFDMGDKDVPVPAEGMTRSNTRQIGGHDLVTTCTITPVDGAIQTYRSGDFRGDALDNMYNVGGADDPFDQNDASPNTLVSGIRNTENASTVHFNFSCGVTLDGAPVDIGGLVFADAESSNLDQGEWVAAATEQDVTWRVIDRYRNCSTSVLAYHPDANYMQLGPNGQQCSEEYNENPQGSNGPVAVGFMEGATSAQVSLKGGGYSAVALGVVLQSDFGDAPESYGEAGALVEPGWSGGEVPINTDQTQTNVSEEAFELGVPAPPPLALGSAVDSENDYQASADATGDDAEGTTPDDEDALDGTPTFETDWGETVTQDVSCRSDGNTPGFVTGWIDWNDNGTFDEGEASDTAACEGGAATLSWTVPNDAADSLAEDPTFMRLRIAANEADSANATEIMRDGEVEDHQVVVDVPNPGLTITKTADPEGPITPGDTVDYTVTVENTGEVDYTEENPAEVTDDLSGLMDDATYNGDATADVGTVTFEEPSTGRWTGPLAVGETATITYTATANDPMTGDGTMHNVVTGPPESNCAEGSDDPACAVDVPIRDLEITKTADTEGPVAQGDTITYTITVENTGAGAYTADDPATFRDDVSDVMQSDTDYNDDASADVGTVDDSGIPDELTWEGPLEPGQTATITYSVTVSDRAEDGASLDNSVFGPPESNCLDVADCRVRIPVTVDPGLQITKTADPEGPVTPGDSVTYTVTVENTGNTTYTADDPATFDDDLTDVLDDAAYNDDAAADVGEVSYTEPMLSWSGALAPGDTATITYTVTALDPSATDGDGTLTNAVVGPPESNCVADADPADPDCGTDVPVRALHIEKSSDGAEGAAPGDTVTYTVTVENTGAVPYTADDPATLDDDLSDVIDDATYNDDATADVGEASYSEPTLSWSGALEPGQTATITYTVTVDDPDEGNGELFNVVTGPPESNCTDPESTDPDCVEPDPVKQLEITKSADPSGTVSPGDTVTYTVTVENTGGASYSASDPATFTDDLTNVLDDATWNDDASADVGTASYGEPTLEWSGALEPGETATITYSVTVNDPASGDGTLTNAVVGPDESNCDEGADPADEDCGTVTPVQALQISKTADPDGEVAPGDTVTYTVTVENTGGVDYTAEDPASFSDELSAVLDDATYNDDASADVGEASYSEPTLSWSGALPAGESATITYSVTVNDPVSGDGSLANAVVGPDESNCDEGADPADEDCGTVTPVRALEIAKSADPSGAVAPGGTVTYTVTVENTGGADYTAEDPASFSDDLSAVLDDATWNDDASADVGEASYAEPELSWSGALPAGETATITYSVTVNDPLSGDGTLTNAVVGPDESTCPPDGDDPDCSTDVPVRALHLEKTSDGAEGAGPGDTVTYEVEVTNTGQVAYTAEDPASFDDDLAEVLDDATYNDDAAASSGDVSYTEPNLSWSGALEPGESATITYTVTVNDPLTGDGSMFNVVVGPDESNCTDPESQDPDCVEPDPVKALDITKTADPSGEVTPGSTVTYTVTVENTGTADYTAQDPASFTDDLSEVLDDATYDEDATADVGAVGYAEPTLSWNGALPAGETATITYSVTVNDPTSGDGSLTNAVVGPPESNCDEGADPADPDCGTEVPVKALEIAKTADPDGAVQPGDTVTYTVEVTNSGQVAYTDDDPASFTDDLSSVVDDATWNDDASADVGTASYSEPTLSWSGALEPGESATITYSVTVNDPLSGDGTLTNAVVGPPESNCDEGADPADENCGTVTPVGALEISKSADPSGEVTPGGTVNYTVTVENTGSVDFTGDDAATFTDDLTEVLDDATYNSDATADLGAVSYAEPELSWSGDLPAGETATITYSVTVDDPLSEDGDRTLTNAVVGPDGSTCPPDSDDPDCSTVVPVKALDISKTADPSGEVAPGGTVTYTVEVTNTGAADYTAEDPASFSDDLSAVLDDATWNDDASADVGEASYAEPELSWSGALAAGETATITYSVTVDDPLSGDGTLSNGVVGPPESNCADGSDDPECGTDVPVRALEISKSADPAGEVTPGGTVTYTVEVSNSGAADYTAEDPASFSDDLSEVLDDATYNKDAAADVGETSYAEPELSWSGALEAGETATITYSVTVNDPLTGDGTLTNAVVGPDESTCPPDSDDPDCSTDVPVKSLEIEKSSDGAEGAQPGDVVTYQVTVTNSGQVAYTAEDPASFDDDLAEVLDDATYNGDAAADSGEVSYTEPNLSWSGALEPGATATITYTVTVNDPPSGDGEMFNVVVGPEESNCTDPESTDPSCVEPNPLQSLNITKSAEPSGEVTPGGTVTYTVTVENTGQVDYTEADPATFSDDLTNVVDDATYNDDAAADAGTASYDEPTLSWSGALPAGETATITYSVTVNDPLSGDGTLTNAVVGPDESNCDAGADPADEDCGTVTPVKALEISKSADPSGEVQPGSTVEYTVTVTNSGQVDYTADDPATFTDDLTEVLDDATYNSDATADLGAVSYAEPDLSWSGDLPAGETATITYSVTVNDPLTGDGTLTNAVVGPDESTCPPASDDPGCGTEVPVRALHLEKTSDGDGDATPGETVTYTVEVTNSGQVAYTDDDPATFDDDLTNVLDDATYNDDAEATSGTASYDDPTLSWSGALDPGETATITYSVTVNDPPSGDGDMLNVVVGPDESNCTDPETDDPDCMEPDPVKDLQITKSADPAGEVGAGDTVTYTVTVENTGAVDYTADDPATFDDDLTNVLDDAVYNDDASADVGEATYGEPQLSWSGALPAGETATITYSVTVNKPLTGDGTLTNAVVGPEESNCDPDGDDPDCSTDVPVRALHLEKTSDGAQGARPGDTVTYEVEVTNTGQVAYTAEDPASFDDDLAEVLDDATYNDDAAATSGSTSYAEPTLSWSGALEPGESATITYSVTVNDPSTGDGEMFNVVVGPDESNCTDPESDDPDCIEPDPLKQLEIAKTADPDGPVTAGETVTYSVAVTNTGRADYTADDPATFTDVMGGVLDDAVYNDDVAADVGEASFDDGEVTWSGPLAPGETATVTYSVTVNDPLSGDGTLANAVLGPQGSNCPVDMPAGGGGAALGVSTAVPEMPEGCQVVTPIRAFEVSKQVEPTGEVAPGDTVTYTVTVDSVGTAPYTDEVPAGFSDDLTAVLDDAAWNDDAQASAGSTSYDEPTLTWSGPLETGGSVTVTYSVTVNDPTSGDGTLTNVVVPSDGSGGHCTSEGDCTTTTTVTPPSPGPSPSPSPTPTPEPPGPGPQPPGPPDADGPTPPGFLPQTGAGLIGLLVGLAALLTLGGGLLYRFGTRRDVG